MIFEEDEICSEIDGNFHFGLVIESSEYVSSDEEEDDELYHSVKKGTVRVAWHPSGKEDVISESKVIFFNKSRKYFIFNYSIFFSSV